ncbi:MAG: hypothetical protein BGO11_00180 [Solirubrobacterales bacterium 70-9]|nr:MAG: hypothetical protein BGO11_00180 [Solirubrobacterales bacterium 70-9]
MRKFVPIAFLLASALLLSACGGGSSSSSSGSGTTSGATSSSGSSSAESGAAGEAAGADLSGPGKVWAKEVEGVMRKFENISAQSIASIHTSTSKYTLEPTFARYAEELDQLGEWLEATHAPAACKALRDKMGALARKVSNIEGVLGKQSKLTPEEFTALSAQQQYKFARVGRQLAELTLDPHC